MKIGGPTWEFATNMGTSGMIYPKQCFSYKNYLMTNYHIKYIL